MQLYPKLITDALAQVRYPGNGKNLIEAGMVEDDLRIDGMHVSFSIIFEKSTDPFMKSVLKSAEAQSIPMWIKTWRWKSKPKPRKPHVPNPAKCCRR